MLLPLGHQGLFRFRNIVGQNRTCFYVGTGAVCFQLYRTFILRNFSEYVYTGFTAALSVFAEYSHGIFDFHGKNPQNHPCTIAVPSSIQPVWAVPVFPAIERWGILAAVAVPSVTQSRIRCYLRLFQDITMRLPVASRFCTMFRGLLCCVRD